MDDSKTDMLALDNQLCFPLYAASRLVTRLYHPLLEVLDITYPQYLILLVLWEEEGQSIRSIGTRLLLETNTLTPLLKRMEKKGILIRTRSSEDERRVVVKLTGTGRKMKRRAASIPTKLIRRIGCTYPVEDVVRLRDELRNFIGVLDGLQSKEKKKS